MNTSNIFLTIKPSTRSIVNESNEALILGVKGDNCAQRVYFECPNNFNDIFGDLTDESVKIYVDYKNAATEPYITEITDITVNELDETKVVFSWLLTSNVTYKAGNVTFNVCIKKFNDRNALVAEWHTSPFVGKVLDAVNVSKKTPEEITPDTQTLQNLITAVQGYKTEITVLKDSMVDPEPIKVLNIPADELNIGTQNNKIGTGSYNGGLYLDEGVYLTEKSKIKFYISGYRNQTQNYDEYSFVMEMGIHKISNDKYCGQCSHYILFHEYPNANNTSATYLKQWEGVVFARLENCDGNQGQLKVLTRIAYDSYTDSAIQLFIRKIEVIL